MPLTSIPLESLVSSTAFLGTSQTGQKPPSASLLSSHGPCLLLTASLPFDTTKFWSRFFLCVPKATHILPLLPTAMAQCYSLWVLTPKPVSSEEQHQLSLHTSGFGVCTAQCTYVTPEVNHVASVSSLSHISAVEGIRGDDTVEHTY